MSNTSGIQHNVCGFVKGSHLKMMGLGTKPITAVFMVVGLGGVASTRADGTVERTHYRCDSAKKLKSIVSKQQHVCLDTAPAPVNGLVPACGQYHYVSVKPIELANGRLAQAVTGHLPYSATPGALGNLGSNAKQLRDFMDQVDDDAYLLISPKLDFAKTPAYARFANEVQCYLYVTEVAGFSIQTSTVSRADLHRAGYTRVIELADALEAADAKMIANPR